MPDVRAMRLTSGYQHHSRPRHRQPSGKSCHLQPLRSGGRGPTAALGRQGTRLEVDRDESTDLDQLETRSKRRSSSGSSSCPSRSTRNGWSSRTKRAMYDEEIDLMVGFCSFGFPGVGAEHHKAAHNRNAKVQLPCAFLRDVSDMELLPNGS
jgi:hypothetical protein